ncbi:cupin domain-containing protein [Herbidospora mongoliensis]|uniref:cupin domain-containing protein n=1 Tax=Herbidospora mongoliensis TaxID=688067 RepID=UPI00082A2AC9|nr:cupin domain-containing protein [Herbidospora mongoliensis]
MTVLDVQTISKRDGVTVVPPPTDYAEVSPGWREVEHRAHLEVPGALAGAWEGTPGSVRIPHWPYHEVCVLLRGRVAIEDTQGGRREFGAGESFLVPAGFDGWWHTLEATEKIFVGIPESAE